MQPLTLATMIAHEDSFLEQILKFRDQGQASSQSSSEGIPYVTNAFWTARQRQAHSLHEISYRACFKPQLPEFFIARLTQPGDTVYDPFMGRGTTPLQAALMGRCAVGNDINPLSILLTRPRLRPPTLEAVAQRLQQVDWQCGEIENEELLVFYSPQTLRHIYALRQWLLARAPIDRVVDPVDDWIRMVAINRLTGHSSGFFSVYTLPPNQAVSIASQRKINAKRNQTPVDRDIQKIILKKTRSLLRDAAIVNAAVGQPYSCLTTGPAERNAQLRAASVQLVITSPPFLDIVQYADDNWLRNWFSGIDTQSLAIAHHRHASDWQHMVAATLQELTRVVAVGGHIAFEVGEVRHGQVLLEQQVWAAAEGLPLERIAVMINQQTFSKTANCWGVDNNTQGTNSNRIVILRRIAD
jgi:hypothetical protein